MPKKYGIREFSKDSIEFMRSLEDQENSYITKLNKFIDFILKFTMILVNSRQLGWDIRKIGGIKRLRTKIVSQNAEIKKLNEKMTQFEDKDEFEGIISSNSNVVLEKKKAREYRKFRRLHERKTKILLGKKAYELQISEWAGKEEGDKAFRNFYNGLFGANGKKELIEGDDKVFKLILNKNDAKMYISKTNGCMKEIIEYGNGLITAIEGGSGASSNINSLITSLGENVNIMLSCLVKYNEDKHNNTFCRVRERKKGVEISISILNKMPPLFENMKINFSKLETEEKQEEEPDEKEIEKRWDDLNDWLSESKIYEDILELQNSVKEYSQLAKNILDLNFEKQELAKRKNLYEEQKANLEGIMEYHKQIQQTYSIIRQDNYSLKNKEQAVDIINNVKILLDNFLKSDQEFNAQYQNYLEQLDPAKGDIIGCIKMFDKLCTLLTKNGLVGDADERIKAMVITLKAIEEEEKRGVEKEKQVNALLDKIDNNVKKPRYFAAKVNQLNLKGESLKLRDKILLINSMIDNIENCNEDDIVCKANFVIERVHEIRKGLDEMPFRNAGNGSNNNTEQLNSDLETEGKGSGEMALNHSLKKGKASQQSSEIGENPEQFAAMIEQKLEDLYALVRTLKNNDAALIERIINKYGEVRKCIDNYTQWVNNNGGHNKSPELLDLPCSQGRKIEDKIKEARDVFTNMLSGIKIGGGLFKLEKTVVLASEEELASRSLLCSMGKAFKKGSIDDIVQNLNEYVVALREASGQAIRQEVLKLYKMSDSAAKFKLKGEETLLYFAQGLKLGDVIECMAKPDDEIWVKLDINLKKLPSSIRVGWSAGKMVFSRYFQNGLNIEKDSIVSDTLRVKFGKDYERFKKSMLNVVLSYQLEEVVPKINSGQDIEGITIIGMGIDGSPS